MIPQLLFDAFLPNLSLFDQDHLPEFRETVLIYQEVAQVAL